MILIHLFKFTEFSNLTEAVRMNVRVSQLVVFSEMYDTKSLSNNQTKSKNKNSVVYRAIKIEK